MTKKSCCHDGCEKEVYASNECWNHYRISHGYTRKKYGLKKEIDRRYDQSEAGILRRKRYLVKRKAVKSITGKTIQQAFRDQESIKKLSFAYSRGNGELLKAWKFFTPEQQTLIASKEVEMSVYSG